ncbi:Gfo/Idh/MocA family oxidoreductase [Halobacteria archaeon AArc-m2/3/4]|uniref:Gfo/Idh/MocA family oxidoreductase n=1 Tax=Natronoglomus mannanivorans TaxID=2979990 RepID=A0AAP2Z0Q1_9EURY|nr:Gfo/Idh/MocA family oxidoreductase [Halobacteria archaeon AArc-xg1-1]MCU4974191.1 Gfo/Idh/MocA family oxidoreductase [Halobacteria archaeon AArc-m2/3/4]
MQSSSSQTLSLAILGVGAVGTIHLRSAQAMDGVEVVAAADPVPDHRERAVRDGVARPRVYDDYATLLDLESDRERAALDAVVVALPPHLHREALEAAAAAGVDAFVEKPFARTTAEADAMLAAAADAGISVGVDHTLRYQPDLRNLNGSYVEGRVGHVPYASMTRLNDGLLGKPPADGPPTDWALDPDTAGGGALLDLGIHCFDVLEWLFGDLEVLDATVDRTLDLPIEDAATVFLRAPETETSISLHCGTYQWEELPEVNTRLRLEGITGTLENEAFLPSNFHVSAARSAATNVVRRATGREPDVYGPTFYLQAHYRALRDFLRAIRRGETPPVTGVDGRRCLALAERALELAGESDETDHVRPREPLEPEGKR